MAEWLKIFLVIYSMVSIVPTLSFFINWKHDIPVLPWDIYNYNTNVNVFGAIFLSLVALFFIPLYFIVKFIIWLCTVGRVDNGRA